MARTATTGNALLGLLALRDEWTTWELTTQLRRNMRFFWPRAESRILAELKRLDRDGLVRSRRESIGKRPRTIYKLTAKGRRHVSSWLETDARGTALESEPLMRIMLGNLASDDAMRKAIGQVERDAHDILDVGRVVASEYEAGTAPFQDQVKVRAFVFDYLTTHATGMLEWAQRTRDTIDGWADLSKETRDRRAVEHIAELARMLPAQRPVDEDRRAG